MALGPRPGLPHSRSWKWCFAELRSPAWQTSVCWVFGAVPAASRALLKGRRQRGIQGTTSRDPGLTLGFVTSIGFVTSNMCFRVNRVNLSFKAPRGQPGRGPHPACKTSVQPLNCRVKGTLTSGLTQKRPSLSPSKMRKNGLFWKIQLRGF
jgi:hypothetical protein